MSGLIEFAAFLHNRFAVALIALAVILGLWGSFQLLAARAVSGGYRTSYLAMTGLTAVQGLAGMAALTQFRPRELLHFVYGLFAVAFLPGAYVYAGRGSRLREAATLAIACWIVAIAYARGFTTGR